MIVYGPDPTINGIGPCSACIHAKNSGKKVSMASSAQSSPFAAGTPPNDEVMQKKRKEFDNHGKVNYLGGDFDALSKQYPEDGDSPENLRVVGQPPSTIMAAAMLQSTR